MQLKFEKIYFVWVRKTRQWHSVVLGEATRDIILIYDGLLKSWKSLKLTWGTIVDWINTLWSKMGGNIPFLTFFLSRGGSLRALITNDDAEGTTEIVATLFWIVNLTVILRPFQSDVALAISSPTFLGD